MINAGESIVVNNCRIGYLPNRIVFYLMNLHIKAHHTYFARVSITPPVFFPFLFFFRWSLTRPFQAGACAESENSYKSDDSLTTEGDSYAQRLTEALLKHREHERKSFIAQGGSPNAVKPLTIWTSTRRRTIETAKHLQKKGYKVKQRPQMSQLNPGDLEKFTEDQIRELYPEEARKHKLDPYHHRYPRAEV